MPVYKDEERNTWYCKCNYKDWSGTSKAKMKRGFATKKEALEWERDFLLRESSSMDMKFSDFVEVYFNDKGPRLKHRSIMTKRTLIETKIIPTFGDKKMNEITAMDIIKWQNTLLNQEYSPTYLRMIQNQITAIFNHAEWFYDLKNNPCKKVDKMGRPNAKELNFWTKDEFDTFIQGFVEGEELYRMFFLILFWLGCRVGELLALTPADVDLEKGTVSISKTYYRRDKQDFITSPKTESSNRKITIPEFLQKELKDFLELSDYRRERAAEAAKDAEFELEAVMDRIASAQTTIQEQDEQMEAMQKTLEKGVEAEQRLNGRIAVKNVELDEVTQDLADKKNELEEQTRKLHNLEADADKAEKRAALAEEVYDYFKDTLASGYSRRWID